MKKIIVFIICLFTINGCGKNNNMTYNLKAQTLMFTQKKKINLNDLNYIITISYLNPVLDNVPTEENFVLSIAPLDEKLKIKSISINSKKANIKTIKKDDEILKFLISNDFTKYYKIISPLQKSEIVVVNVCFEKFPCFDLNFQKYSKSLYYRSVNIDTQYN